MTYLSLGYLHDKSEPNNWFVLSFPTFTLLHLHFIHLAMDFSTITTPSTLYDTAMWMCLAGLILGTLALVAYLNRRPHARHDDVETGSSVQFSHSIELTTLTTMGRSEDGLKDSIPETSSLIQSMCTTESHEGYADSDWSERTDALSELSEEDVTDALSHIAMSSTSGLGPSSIEGEQGSTPYSPYYSSDQSGVESSPR